MQSETSKSQMKSKIPPQTISLLQTHIQKIQPSIRKSEQNLTQWFIDNALRYTNPHIPRFQLLKKIEQVLNNSVSNEKYMNSLLLEDVSVINLIQQASYLADIAFILFKHTKKKVKNKQYGESVITVLKTKVQSLLRKNQNSLLSFYNLREVQLFLQQKEKLPQSIYIVDPYQLEQMENQAVIIFYYIIKPLFQRKSLQNVYDCLYPMILWFVVLKDNNQQNEAALMQIAKKIDSFLWGKKIGSNINLLATFNWIMNLLSVKYMQQDSFSFQTLAPLLIKMKNFPILQLMNNWMANQRKCKNLPKKIENIFRNSLNTGVTTLCFKFIQTISNQLQQQGNYETLFHIFDSFIRKQYLSIKLSNKQLKDYMRILMLYAIGFINRDRLDGQTQLDRLALNLNQVVCNTNVNYKQCYQDIIMFFRIYENRFHFLSSTCKNLVSTLQRCYNWRVSIAKIHQEVANRMFKGYNANYDEDQIHSLQRSHRYAGLVNLGNTCYMNSFVQSLFMTKKFKTLVIKAQDQGMVPSNHPAFQSLVNLFVSLNSKTNQNLSQVQPIQLKHQIPEPFRSSYQQHDSSEFGRMLFDFLTNELKDTGLAQKINRLFTHELCTKIICRGCNMQRQMKQKTFDFILNVQSDNNEAITVSQLMRNYFKGYDLDGNNMLMCNRCNTKRPAYVLKQPIQLAEHLIATISIFKYDNLKSSKIIKPLNFQFSLNFKNILPKVVEQNQLYQLYAFVLHIGTGVERGHYQCFARNLQQNPMMWYKFDDNYVTQQEINQIEDFHFGQNQTPYILFYSNSNKSRKILSDK